MRKPLKGCIMSYHKPEMSPIVDRALSRLFTTPLCHLYPYTVYLEWSLKYGDQYTMPGTRIT